MTIEKSGKHTGNDMFFSLNELSIDDDVLSYSTRSTTFINYLNQNDFWTFNSQIYWENELEEYEDVDAIHIFGFQVSQ